MKKGLFLGALRQYFSNIFRRENATTAIEDLEVVSRYVFSSRHLKSDNRIHPAAFHPARDGLTSVFRIGKMSHEYKKEIVDGMELSRGKEIVGQALVSAASIRSISFDQQRLDVVPEESQHKWHADIQNWPEEKAQMKSLAMDLANKARKG